MAIKTQAQIQADSNSTYVDNTVGSITPANVRSLNTNWIDSTIYVEQTGSMQVLSASFATNSATASFLLGSIASASFANTSATASLAITASFAISASRAISAANATLADTATSASYSVTSSLATGNLTTASAVANILTFTKGDGTTFNVTVAQSGSVASASYADVANFANSATSASFASTASLADLATSASYAFTASSASNSFNAVTASFAISASRAISAATATSATTATSALTAISASQATNANNALTASFVAGVATLSGNNTFTGINTFNNAVTMSNVQVNGTASIAFLNVVFQSSSIIYSSGSNQLGDASNDTQTLYGTVNVITGPLVVTGSANFKETITGSISTALNANTASYVANAFVSASQVGGNDKVSLTTAGGTTTTLTIDNVANANQANSANTATSASFATTANTANTANSATSASYAATASQVSIVDDNGNTNHKVTFVDTSVASVAEQLLIDPTSGQFTYNPSTNLLTVTASLANLAVTASFTNTATSASFANTATSASFATTSNTAISASLAQLALTASFFDGLVASASYAVLAENANNALTANTANSALTAVNADTASFLLGAVASASFATSASRAISAATASFLLGSIVSASYALTASGVQGINASLVNSTYYLGFVPNAEINAISIDTDLSYNPSTGVLNTTTFQGNLNGNATTATTATSASFAQTSVTASFATNFRNSGSYVITGSHRGNVVSQSIASSTASFDFSTGNFFTLNLTGSALTHISASNIQPGQTVNVRITQGATTGSVSFSPAFDQVSGSAYTPTAVANAVDILTFITFDNSLIYVSNIKNLV